MGWNNALIPWHFVSLPSKHEKPPHRVQGELASTWSTLKLVQKVQGIVSIFLLKPSLRKKVFCICSVYCTSTAIRSGEPFAWLALTSATYSYSSFILCAWNEFRKWNTHRKSEMKYMPIMTELMGEILFIVRILIRGYAMHRLDVGNNLYLTVLIRLQ